MNYAEMSDFEINCAVAAFLGREFFYNSPGEPGKRRKSFVIDDVCRDVYESGAWSSDVFDPCKSWADAGPIIEKKRISIEFDGDDTAQWCHTISCEGLYGIEYQANPLRAAMITFLLMQEAVNA